MTQNAPDWKTLEKQIQPEEGDIYTLEIRAGHFTAHRYTGEQWEQIAALSEQDTQQLVQPMHFLGESKGKRRYYRPTGALTQEQQHPTFGTIIWQAPDYIEYLLAQEQQTRVIVGAENGMIKLYRIEWSEPDGNPRNKAVYTLLDAIAAFREITQAQPEQPLDWRAIEAQAKADLEAIQTNQDAITFIQKYFAKDLQPDYLKIYRSDVHEMGRSPKKAIENLLSLPPIQ